MSPAVHVPIFLEEMRGGQLVRVYRKTEKDDNFYHHNTSAISIMEKYLRLCDIVRVEIPHRNVVVEASSQDILDASLKIPYRSAQTGQREEKFYYRITKWNVVSGDPKWCDKVFEDYPPR